MPPAAAERNRSIGAENTMAAREEGPRKKNFARESLTTL